MDTLFLWPILVNRNVNLTGMAFGYPFLYTASHVRECISAVDAAKLLISLQSPKVLNLWSGVNSQDARISNPPKHLISLTFGQKDRGGGAGMAP